MAKKSPKTIVKEIASLLKGLSYDQARRILFDALDQAKKTAKLPS